MVNDFAAQAMAVDLLTSEDMMTIGEVPWAGETTGERTFAVLGPGTGLGVSGLPVRDGKRVVLEN